MLKRKVPAAIVDSEPGIVYRVREAMSDLHHGNMPAIGARAAASFTPAFLKSIASESREWGPVQSADLLSRATDGEQRRYRYRFNYVHYAVLVDVVLDQDGHIDAFKLHLD